MRPQPPKLFANETLYQLSYTPNLINFSKFDGDLQSKKDALYNVMRSSGITMRKLPGIMTGTIIGLAHALGETAPLFLIGMNAFITSPPGGVFDASTALPTQIFIWADSPERGFVSRTSAAILVLLGFLILMNAIAIFLRQRLERTW